MSADKDDRRAESISFMTGLDDAARAEAERVFAALRATRSARQGHADTAARAGEPVPMLPMCPALLADAHLCLLPLVDGHDCPHRQPGVAPVAIADLVDELRQQVSQARTVAGSLAAELRHLVGDRGLAAVLRYEDPWWLVPGR